MNIRKKRVKISLDKTIIAFLCLPLLVIVLTNYVYFSEHLNLLILFSVISIVISYRFLNKHIQQQVSQYHNNHLDESEVIESTSTELENINVELYPIWQRLIDSAREISEEAVKDLATQFSGISRRLNQAIQASVSYSNDGVSQIGQVEERRNDMITQAELAEMLDTLREAIDVKQVLLEKIQELKDQTNDMKQVISSVKSVAKKTEVLAINAAIESRRAGVHGKSFGVVAHEVRKLSEQSAGTVDDVVNRINLLEEKMDGVIEQTHLNVHGTSEKNVDKTTTISVYERFRALALSLSKSSEVLLSESKNIKGEIDEILVALQYQDKTSQMLIHVKNNITKLHEVLNDCMNKSDFSELNVESWLARLLETYTMVEEVQAHHNEKASGTAQAQVDSPVYFF
ncbi:MAG: methyl-accepting chemotaxis protein [Gammaproteobacteria bacterium]|nr:methyl-accepting chemotaxis protein [Gammaproteobacteria bacterium]MDH5730937.1 methyl-accepting chemotaxis protein [Gammaproteobacteria bacterium]